MDPLNLRDLLELATTLAAGAFAWKWTGRHLTYVDPTEGEQG